MTLTELRPLSTGEILDNAFGLYRRHFAPLAVIALVVSALPLLLGLYVQTSGGLLVRPVLGTLANMLDIVLGAIGTAAGVFVVSDSYLGRSVSARNALSRALPWVPRIVVLTLLIGLVVGVGLIVLMIPVSLILGILLVLTGQTLGQPMMLIVGVVALLVILVLGLLLLSALVISNQALVLENTQNPIEAMRRSWYLTKGFRWKVCALIVVTFILILIPGVAASFPAAILAPGAVALQDPSSLPIGWYLTMVLGAVVQLLLYPLMYSVLTVLYYDLRVRKEGFDLEVLAQALETG